jgi:hypothetical protein
MNNYFISYEWDIVLISVLATSLVIYLGYALKLTISDWWFTEGKRIKHEFVSKVKTKLFHFMLDINEKYNLGLYIAETDYMFLHYRHIHKLQFKLPQNPRYDFMECELVVSNQRVGTNPADIKDFKRMFITLKKSEWDTFRNELNKKYEEVKTY